MQFTDAGVVPSTRRRDGPRPQSLACRREHRLARTSHVPTSAARSPTAHTWASPPCTATWGSRARLHRRSF